VVAADDQRLVKQTTEAVELLVSVLRIELFVQNRVWWMLADMCKAMVINVAGTLIHAYPALALMARGQDRLKLLQTLEDVLLLYKLLFHADASEIC